MKLRWKWSLATLVLMFFWSGLVIFGALEGWFRQPIAPKDDAHAFMQAALEYVGANPSAAVSLVLIEAGEVHDSYFSPGITSSTLFPLASMSKWFTAYGVLTLADMGKIDLDEPVSNYLTRWHLPPSKFDNSKVTVRRLLSHTAGLTDGLGFGDFDASAQVPAIEESLRDPMSSSGSKVQISVGVEPGSEWNYSGGGYLLLELVIEEVSGQSFDAYMQDVLFTPLKMSRTTYNFLGDLDNVAPSLYVDGKTAPYYQYAASGATGMASTAADLTRLVQAQTSSAIFDSLPNKLFDQMRSPEARLLGAPIWGLGTMLYVETSQGAFIYGHAGQNEPAINAEVRINPHSGDAIVMLATGNPSLATRLGFLWTFWQTGRPDFLATGPEIQRVLPLLGIGAALVLLLGAFGYWRKRHGS